MKSSFSLIAMALILHLTSTECIAQNVHCKNLQYKYDIAKGEINHYLLKGHNYEIFSDDRKHKEVFATKSEFKKKSSIKIIPVLRFYSDGLRGNEHSLFNNVFKPTYRQFSGFLMCNENVVEVIISSPTKDEKHIRPENFGAESVDDLDKLFRAFNTIDACLFYDSTARRYSYIINNKYYYWDFNTNNFIEVIDIKSYTSLIGLI